MIVYSLAVHTHSKEKLQVTPLIRVDVFANSGQHVLKIVGMHHCKSTCDQKHQ
jgi:hypothetical protein